NRIPRATADALLANPELGPAARDALRDAVISLASVPLTPVSTPDFVAAGAEPRAAHYRPLLRLCRVLHEGFLAASASGARGGFPPTRRSPVRSPSAWSTPAAVSPAALSRSPDARSASRSFGYKCSEQSRNANARQAGSPASCGGKAGEASFAGGAETAGSG